MLGIYVIHVRYRPVFGCFEFNQLSLFKAMETIRRQDLLGFKVEQNFTKIFITREGQKQLWWFAILIVNRKKWITVHFRGCFEWSTNSKSKLVGELCFPGQENTAMNIKDSAKTRPFSPVSYRFSNLLNWYYTHHKGMKTRVSGRSKRYFMF